MKSKSLFNNFFKGVFRTSKEATNNHQQTVICREYDSNNFLRLGLTQNRRGVQRAGVSLTTNTTPTTVWNGGAGVSYPFPTAGEQVSIVSTSAADTFGSTGANVVIMDYLDSNFDEKQQVFVMTGITPVLSTFSDVYRINNLFVASAGSGRTNAGTITVSNSTDDIGIMVLGQSIEHKAVYTIPRYYQGLLESVIISNDSNKIVTYDYKFFVPTLNVLFNGGSSIISNFAQFQVNKESIFSAGTDLEVKASAASGSGVKTNIQFELLLNRTVI